MLERNVKSNGGGPRPGAGRPREESSYYSALRRKEHALARLRELEVGQREGTLLPADAVGREWQRLMRQVRAGVLAVVSRVRQRCPELTPGQIEALDRELRDALTSLADADC